MKRIRADMKLALHILSALFIPATSAFAQCFLIHQSYPCCGWLMIRLIVSMAFTATEHYRVGAGPIVSPSTNFTLVPDCRRSSLPWAMLLAQRTARRTTGR